MCRGLKGRVCLIGRWLRRKWMRSSGIARRALEADLERVVLWRSCIRLLLPWLMPWLRLVELEGDKLKRGRISEWTVNRIGV